jgi:hypothetical protein
MGASMGMREVKGGSPSCLRFALMMAFWMVCCGAGRGCSGFRLPTWGAGGTAA